MKTLPLMCARSDTQLLLLLTILLVIVPASASLNRLSFPRKFWNFKLGSGIAMETTIRPPAAVKDTEQERRLVWSKLMHKEPVLSNSRTHLSQTRFSRRRNRGRRHVNSGLQGRVHARLMRVGCVLGTCQVQNLSFRLYQLIGQRTREHSSPIDPRSPHSYG